MNERMRDMKHLSGKLLPIYSDLVEKHFPKGRCEERGKALVLVAEINIAITKIISEEVNRIVKHSKEKGKVNGVLTLQNLIDMSPETIFAKGECVDNHENINMSNSGKLLRWVAVRGIIEDWTIYCHFADKSFEWIRSNGDKICYEKHIRRLCPCNEAAFKMYRY